MAIILEKKNSDGNTKKFILLGGGRTPGNFGTSEEPYVVVCDDTGTISCQVDFADTIKVLKVDGVSPTDICKDFC